MYPYSTGRGIHVNTRPHENTRLFSVIHVTVHVNSREELLWDGVYRMQGEFKPLAKGYRMVPRQSRLLSLVKMPRKILLPVLVMLEQARRMRVKVLMKYLKAMAFNKSQLSNSKNR